MPSPFSGQKALFGPPCLRLSCLSARPALAFRLPYFRLASFPSSSVLSCASSLLSLRFRALQLRWTAVRFFLKVPSASLFLRFRSGFAPLHFPSGFACPRLSVSTSLSLRSVPSQFSSSRCSRFLFPLRFLFRFRFNSVSSRSLLGSHASFPLSFVRFSSALLPRLPPAFPFPLRFLSSASLSFPFPASHNLLFPSALRLPFSSGLLFAHSLLFASPCGSTPFPLLTCSAFSDFLASTVFRFAFACSLLPSFRFLSSASFRSLLHACGFLLTFRLPFRSGFFSALFPPAPFRSPLPLSIPL